MSGVSYCVYMHNNKINGKKYIGITKLKPENRWGKNGRGYKDNKHFYNSIKKYGWDNFEHIIMHTNLTVEDAKQCEINLVKKYSSNNSKYGYNKTRGGDTMYEMTDETRKKLSDSHKGLIDGEKNPMYGKSLRDFMSEERFQEFVELQRKNLEKYRVLVPVICLNTLEIFESITEARNKYNISDISSCCSGKLYSAGRHPVTNEELVWQYLSDYENGVIPKEKECFTKIVCVNTEEIFNGIYLAVAKYNIPSSSIVACCRGRFKKAGKLPNGDEAVWMYYDDYITYGANKDMINKATRKTMYNSCVNQYSTSHELIGSWENIKQAASACSLDSIGIYRACQGKRVMSGGYYWSFADDEPIFIKDKSKDIRVCQIDLYTDEVIHIYDSIIQASKLLGISQSKIYAACRGDIKSTSKYKWKYIRELEKQKQN